MLKKIAIYLLFSVLVFAGQFLITSDLVTGQPPTISNPTLEGANAMDQISKGPTMIYFWADWCGVCSMMQSSINSISATQPILTISHRSGADSHIIQYLNENQLNWTVVNDAQGQIAKEYGVKAVPALFFLNNEGRIIFNSVGFTTEWGIRFRIWLAGFL